LAKSYRTANIRVTSENNTNHDGVVLYTKDDMYKILKEWSTTAGITYWFIEHSADDEVSKTHFHIVIKFKSPMPFETIKNKFPYGDIESSRNLKASIQYLIHLNDKSKVQYTWEQIITNCLDLTPYKVLTVAQQEITLHTVYDAIERGEIREYNLLNKVPIALFAGNKTKIDNALTYFREKICMDKDRNIEVIFMSGSAGIGKTSFAKRYCETRHLQPCVSSSSNDPLQDYKGEPVLILDDLRDDSFKYHDFLKLLDNHTKSSSRSRYHNKLFIGNIIIITSTKPINNWYEKSSSEDKHQLYRRVRQWLKFDGDRIYGFEYNDLTFRYEPAGSAPNPIAMDDKKRKEMVMKIFDGMGVEFTPADKKKLSDGLDKMTDDDWKKEFCVPPATDEEKKQAAARKKNNPPLDNDKINKHRVG